MAGLEGLTRFMSGAGSAEDVYGRRPVVPESPDWDQLLQDVISGNIAALPSLKNFATKATGIYKDLQEGASPGITNLKALTQKAIESLVTGNVPGMDEYIQRRGAEESRRSGTSGSQFGLGQEFKLGYEEKQGVIQRGINSFQNWMQSVQSQTFDFSKMLFGKEEAVRRGEFGWSRDWLSEQVKAAPDPTARGKFDAEMAWIGMVLSAYGGGAGYTGQSKPNYGGTSAGGYGGGTGGGYSYFGGPSGYGTTYQGEGGNMYQSVPNAEGGGMSVPY